MSAFREEVDAEARRLALTRSRLSGRRIAPAPGVADGYLVSRGRR